MILPIAVIFLLAAISFGFGLYFRIAEYDVLASDKVWDRIVPAAKTLVDDERLPDTVAATITMFSMATGCGCFVRILVFDAIRDKLKSLLHIAFKSHIEPDHDLDALPEFLKHDVFKLLEDLILFDSLHSPILGRACRVMHRTKFARSKYRRVETPEQEIREIAMITTAFERVVAKKSDPDLAKVRQLIPA